MVDPIDDIARQARQGSVAAIIQILNEQLAAIGVRTRAVFADGVLQLLCEAMQAEQLEQSTLVERLRQILEEISPRHIRRVNINSRIVREQQLLWLEEISRDPQHQLLWSQAIILAQPNLLKRLMNELKDRKTPSAKPVLAKSTSSYLVREHRQFQRGIIGGIGVSLCVVLVGLAIYNWLNSQGQISSNLQATPQTVPHPSTPTPSPKPSVTGSPVAPSSSDGFAQAVRLAEQAAAAGKVAQSSDDWLKIAAMWQEASDLMAKVSPEHPRYTTAVNRAELYYKYSQDAQQAAQKQ